MANEFFADAGKCEEMLEWCDNRSRTYDLRITNATLIYFQLFE